MSSSPVVELQHVTRLYGTFAALRDVTLTIDAGCSMVLLGENGAGKSTLLRLIAGLATPTHGSLRVFGENPHDVRARIAYMSHSPMLYEELTALENLRYFATLQGATTKSSGAVDSSGAPKLDPATALREVGLDPGLNRRVAEYSQGMRQRASLARVLLTSPELLLLDEPFSNLDAASSRAMVARLGQYVASGARTLVMTTHQRELVQPLAAQQLTLAQGRLLQ